MRTTRSLLNFAAMFEHFFRCTKALSTSPLSKAWDMESQHCWFGHAIAIESLKSVDFDLAIFEKPLPCNFCWRIANNALNGFYFPSSLTQSP